MTTLLDAELIGVFEHDTPEWHEARAGLMGSSDVAAILGLSSYKSAYTLWHEKAGLILPGQPDARTQRKYDYGHHMEPFVAGIFQSENPSLWVQKKDAGTWRNIERPWQGCNPDRLIFSNKRAYGLRGLLELKTFPMISDWEPEPPAGYVAQLKWQLDTFGMQSGWLAGYANMSGDYVEHQIELDAFEAEATRARVLAFANSITDGEPPEIDGSAGTYETIRRLNPSINYREEREIPAEIAESYLEAASKYRTADSELTKWKGHLLAHMGTAQIATYNGTKIATRYAPRKDAVPTLKEA
jgi:putative phage-type endonuclease